MILVANAQERRVQCAPRTDHYAALNKIRDPGSSRRMPPHTVLRSPCDDGPMFSSGKVQPETTPSARRFFERVHLYISIGTNCHDRLGLSAVSLQYMSSTEVLLKA